MIAIIDEFANNMQTMDNTDYINATNEEFTTATTAWTERCEDCGELYQNNMLSNKKCIKCIVKHQEKQWLNISKKYNGAKLIT